MTKDDFKAAVERNDEETVFNAHNSAIDTLWAKETVANGVLRDAIANGDDDCIACAKDALAATVSPSVVENAYHDWTMAYDRDRPAKLENWASQVAKALA